MILQNLIHCGRVLKPHGLKGELCTVWFADSPLLLSGLTRLYLKSSDSAPRAFRISAWRRHKGRYLVFLDTVAGRDQAEKWSGAEILVDRKYIPESGDGKAYVYELLESRVFLPGGAFLGLLEEIFDNKGSEVWRIMTQDGLEVLFPVNNEFILDIDPDNKKIVIDPPEGLLEIYGVQEERDER
jgi:16S rRNA processing protein RimM